MLGYVTSAIQGMCDGIPAMPCTKVSIGVGIHYFRCIKVSTLPMKRALHASGAYTAASSFDEHACTLVYLYRIDSLGIAMNVLDEA